MALTELLSGSMDRHLDRYRITVRKGTIELRGWVDGLDDVKALAAAVKPLGAVVVASVAEDNYDPFTEEPTA